MKQLVFVILSLFISTLSYSQQVSSDPYELYWNQYILEFNKEDIEKNSIRKVITKEMTYKKEKVIHDVIRYSVSFDSEAKPIKYSTQKEVTLSWKKKFNPIWRINNNYPVFDILEYDLTYNDNGLLIAVMQTDKRTNRDYNPQEKLVFNYDSTHRVVAQSYQDIHHVIGTTEYSVMADITYKISYTGDSVTQIIKYSGAGANLDSPSADTLAIKGGSRVVFATYNFGDKQESFIRNEPIQKNETLYDALDTSSEIVRSKDGLKESKKQTIEKKEELEDENGNEIIIKYIYVGLGKKGVQ